MGTVELNLPVRNGKGCCLHVIATRFSKRFLTTVLYYTVIPTACQYFSSENLYPLKIAQ